MTDEHEDDMNERHGSGRRSPDGAHLLKWIPFMTLLFMMLLQTFYATRWASGLETSNTHLLTKVAGLEAKLEALNANVSQGIVPNAEARWRLDIFERQFTEVRATVNDYGRRLTALEAGRQPRQQ